MENRAGNFISRRASTHKIKNNSQNLKVLHAAEADVERLQGQTLDMMRPGAYCHDPVGRRALDKDSCMELNKSQEGKLGAQKCKWNELGDFTCRVHMPVRRGRGMTQSGCETTRTTCDIIL